MIGPPALIHRITADQTLPLRQSVLWPDLALPDLRVPDDETALHYGASAGGALVGVASVFPDGNQARLRKFAIAPTAQGRGIGRAMIGHVADDLKARGLVRLWCDARIDALAFYEKLGFAAQGAVFTKRGLSYRVAVLPLGAEARDGGRGDGPGGAERR